MLNENYRSSGKGFSDQELLRIFTDIDTTVEKHEPGENKKGLRESIKNWSYLCMANLGSYLKPSLNWFYRSKESNEETGALNSLGNIDHYSFIDALGYRKAEAAKMQQEINNNWLQINTLMGSFGGGIASSFYFMAENFALAEEDIKRIGKMLLRERNNLLKRMVKFTREDAQFPYTPIEGEASVEDIHFVFNFEEVLEDAKMMRFNTPENKYLKYVEYANAEIPAEEAYYLLGVQVGTLLFSDVFSSSVKDDFKEIFAESMYSRFKRYMLSTAHISYEYIAGYSDLYKSHTRYFLSLLTMHRFSEILGYRGLFDNAILETIKRRKSLKAEQN
jgi:hypothetical protein